MQLKMITALILGVVVVVINFQIYPLLVDATDDLSLYFSNSCVNDSGSERFVRAYVATQSTAITSASNATNVYDVTNKRFYGSGLGVTRDGTTSVCQIAAITTSNVIPNPADGAATLYNERGEIVGQTAAVSSGAVAITKLPATAYKWYLVPDLLNVFGGVPRLILSAIPIIVLAGFLGLSAMGLVSYGQGRGGIGDAIGDAIGSLIFAVVLLKVMPITMDSVITADAAVDGPYSVTGTFGGVLGLVFAAIPVILIAGLLAISGVLLFRKYGKTMGADQGM